MDWDTTLTDAAIGGAAGYVGGDLTGALTGAVAAGVRGGDAKTSLIYGGSAGLLTGAVTDGGAGGTITNFFKGLFTTSGTSGAVAGATATSNTNQGGFLSSVSNYIKGAFGSKTATGGASVPATGTAAANGQPAAQASMASGILGSMTPQTKQLLLISAGAALLFFLLPKFLKP